MTGVLEPLPVPAQVFGVEEELRAQAHFSDHVALQEQLQELGVFVPGSQAQATVHPQSDTVDISASGLEPSNHELTYTEMLRGSGGAVDMNKAASGNGSGICSSSTVTRSSSTIRASGGSSTIISDGCEAVAGSRKVSVGQLTKTRNKKTKNKKKNQQRNNKGLPEGGSVFVCAFPGCVDASGAKMKCTGCKRTWYHGRQCQLAHWKQHKADCLEWQAELEQLQQQQARATELEQRADPPHKG
jgi:hypothetical protein